MNVTLRFNVTDSAVHLPSNSFSSISVASNACFFPCTSGGCEERLLNLPLGEVGELGWLFS